MLYISRIQVLTQIVAASEVVIGLRPLIRRWAVDGCGDGSSVQQFRAVPPGLVVVVHRRDVMSRTNGENSA